MKTSAPDILNLPHMRAIGSKDKGDHYVITATGQGEPTVCPKCGGERLHAHGSESQQFMDTPIHGKRVQIEIDRRRYRCAACGKTIYAALPDVDLKRQATSRFIEHVEHHCLRRTFAEVSRDVGVDEKTIRHVFDDYVARLKSEIRFETPEILGIDELKIIGQYRAMITNVEALTLYDMLETRNKADLISYFKTMPDKQRVRVLTMDLWSVYRQVARLQFPDSMIVADRFHVVRMANESVERVRKAIRKTLDTRTRLKLKDDRFVLLSRWKNLDGTAQAKLEYWGKLFPTLWDAYWAKEGFHKLYEKESRAQGELAGKEWSEKLDTSIAWAFKDTAHALGSWWTEIFNHYECPISNAYTESINRLAKDMNRMGRGYSFEVIRARMIYEKRARAAGTGPVRPHRPKPTAAPEPGGMARATAGHAAVPDGINPNRVVEYGAHIPTLCELLEQGHFEG